MFSFGAQSYVQLNSMQGDKVQNDGSGSSSGGGSGGGAWAQAEGDVERGAGGRANDRRGGGGGGPSMGSDSGRVQVPIGMVSDNRQMRRWQAFALFAFTAGNLLLLLLLCALGFVLDGSARVLVVGLGCSVWLGLLFFNMRMAGKPRRVIQTFLQTKKKTRLSRRQEKGAVVVLRGAVSLLHEELLSTEFHNVPGLVLVESSLRSYHPGLRKADAWTEHVRQTRAVDFRITDSLTGMSAIVKAFNAAESGDATPLVHISTEVPLSTAVPIATSPTAEGGAPAVVANGAGPKPVETEERRRRSAVAAANPQLMVCKGYIRQGQVITVMGVLGEEAGTHELLVQPLPQPYNVSKMLMCKSPVLGVPLPFFFPTWAAGLVISDQRDLVA